MQTLVTLGRALRERLFRSMAVHATIFEIFQWEALNVSKSGTHAAPSQPGRRSRTFPCGRF
jgi:hypothetical protein